MSNTYLRSVHDYKKEQAYPPFMTNKGRLEYAKAHAQKRKLQLEMARANRR